MPICFAQKSDQAALLESCAAIPNEKQRLTCVDAVNRVIDKEGSKINRTAVNAPRGLSNADRSAARAALKALRKLVSATEVGVNKVEYQTRLIDMSAEVDDQLTYINDSSLRSKIEDAKEAFVDARQAWDGTFRLEYANLFVLSFNSIMTKYGITEKDLSSISNITQLSKISSGQRTYILSMIWAGASKKVQAIDNMLSGKISEENAPEGKTPTAKEIQESNKDKEKRTLAVISKSQGDNKVILENYLILSELDVPKKAKYLDMVKVYKDKVVKETEKATLEKVARDQGNNSALLEHYLALAELDVPNKAKYEEMVKLYKDKVAQEEEEKRRKDEIVEKRRQEAIAICAAEVGISAPGHRIKPDEMQRYNLCLDRLMNN